MRLAHGGLRMAAASASFRAALRCAVLRAFRRAG